MTKQTIVEQYRRDEYTLSIIEAPDGRFDWEITSTETSMMQFSLGWQSLTDARLRGWSELNRRAEYGFPTDA